ncbi:preprotein translocase subunit SecD [Kineosphaera limosa]|uniref:Protein translocase subunit SecD n=1 Tax=Kineosphaera limosa NBRC 100340 TaxID=1184609 RepID=K6VF77_9MICO|nr:protein translocase subunit SecD [Kineosphaera limosa]NYD98862.1 preprotein translocase subunit SecD [Kineosphaera limosa]GAB94813.1 protein-export membrane protein SecD [Kineosphaera limosa NBRC 100340]
MANPKTRPFRSTLAIFTLITLMLTGGLIASVQFSDGSWTPKLGLDLEGGTQMVLQPQTADGTVNAEQLDQAVDIMRARVDGQGVAEAEVATLGNNVVVAVPGAMTREQEDALRQSSQMRFRPVITVVAGSPMEVSPIPGEGDPTEPAADPTAPTPDATEPAASPTGGATASPATPAPSPTTAGAVLPRGLQQATPTPTGTPTASPTATPTGSPAATPEPTETPGLGLPTSEEGTPTITPQDAADPQKLIEYASSEAWLTAQWSQRLEEFDCRAQPVYDPSKEDPLQPSVACSDDGAAKYLLGPAVISGDQLADASSGPIVSQQTGAPTGGYQVNLQMDGGEATAAYATVSRYMVGLPEPRNQLAIVLDNHVVSAPRFENAIPDGRAQITGNFTAESAMALANQLKFGALPMSFTVQSTESVSPTIGGDQLRLAMIAGAVGLLLVVLYSLWQYRALGLVTVASLLVTAGLTYLVLTLFGWGYNLRLTMAGITGAIVAIGTTVDSFIVYFERVRDELRDGRRLQSAVQSGWARASRTIYISSAVSFLAATVLYALATSNVRGFAFVLMLTTVLDLFVTVMFTHPLLSLLSHVKFFRDGHRLSGFHPDTIGAIPAYRGRGRTRLSDSATTPQEVSA